MINNTSCREWLRANGRAYPRSGCNACGQRLNFNNCPYVKAPDLMKPPILWTPGTPKQVGIYQIRDARGFTSIIEIVEPKGNRIGAADLEVWKVGDDCYITLEELENRKYVEFVRLIPEPAA